MSEGEHDYTPFHSLTPKLRGNGRPRHRHNIAQHITRAGDERGRMTEENFFRVFSNLTKEKRKNLPRWFLWVERATPLQDKKGVDAFVITDIGRIPVQIKSSVAGTKSFKNKSCHEGIVIVVINKNKDDEQILAKTRSFVAKFRQKVMSGICEIRTFEE